MATAKLIFTQNSSSRPAGQDVADGLLSLPVTVTNENNAGVAAWLLDMVDVPVGPETDSTSAVPLITFASGTTSPVSGVFTPDAFGAYLVKLQVIGTDGSQSVDYGLFGVPNELGWFRPAKSQGVETSRYATTGPQERGWAYNEDHIISHVRKSRNKTVNLWQSFPLVAAQKETPATGYVTIGGQRFDPSQFAASVGGMIRTITFRALIYATPGMTARIRLWNTSDSSEVTDTVLTTTANIPTFVSATLDVPTDIPNSAKIYEAQLMISAGSPGVNDRAICLYAGLDVTLTG